MSSRGAYSDTDRKRDEAILQFDLNYNKTIDQIFIMWDSYCVYILTNKNHTVLYVGVTSNLTKRIYQHKSKRYRGFTSKYNCDQLVYFESYSEISMAIDREKQIKGGSRQKKIALIEAENPHWNDLSAGWLFDVK